MQRDLYGMGAPLRLMMERDLVREGVSSQPQKALYLNFCSLNGYRLSLKRLILGFFFVLFFLLLLERLNSMMFIDLKSDHLSLSNVLDDDDDLLE